MDHLVKEAMKIWLQPDRVDRNVGFPLHGTYPPVTDVTVERWVCNRQHHAY